MGALVHALKAESAPLGQESAGRCRSGRGVAVTSLYRRWGDVRVAVERLMQEHPLPDTGALAQDLRTWARSIAAGLSSPEGSSFFQALIATALPTGSNGMARMAALPRYSPDGYT